MKDIRHLAGVQQIAVDFTYGCNLRCLHCFNNSGEKCNNRKELTTEELLTLANDIIELSPQTVCICGGEPLLRLNDVLCFIKKIKKLSKSNIDINIVSNGIISSNFDILEKLKEAGINSIQISLDGSNAISHDWLRNKEGTFEHAIQAIKNAISLGLHVGIACCPTKKNLNEYEDLLDLCEKFGISDYRMQPLMLMGRAKKNLEGYIPSYHNYRNISRLLNNYNADKSKKTQTEWGDPLEHLYLGKQESPIFTYCGITAYGDLTISPYIPLAIGNIRNHSLKDYWNSGIKEIWNANLCCEIAELCTTWEDMEVFNTHPLLTKLMKDDIITLDYIDNKKAFDSNLEELNNYVAI